MFAEKGIDAVSSLSNDIDTITKEKSEIIWQGLRKQLYCRRWI